MQNITERLNRKSEILNQARTELQRSDSPSDHRAIVDEARAALDAVDRQI